MSYIPAVIIFITVFLLLLLLFQSMESKNPGIKTRLKAIRDHDSIHTEEPLNLPFKVRVIDPLVQRSVLFFSGLMPANLIESVDKKLVQCGNPRGMKAGAFLTIAILASLVLVIVSFFIPLTSGMGIRKALFYALLALVLSVLIPNLWLTVTARKRVEEVERSLPDAVDLLVVSVEAGLGFDLAMAKVTERIKGPLGEEFARALNEMRLGKSRQSALRDITKRVDSPALNSFLSMVIQGTQMGFSIGPVLRIQAESMRRLRRQKAQELAMKAPVKMVFPMVFCIFPAIFVIILGPALINIIRALK